MLIYTIYIYKYVLQNVNTFRAHNIIYIMQYHATSQHVYSVTEQAVGSGGVIIWRSLGVLPNVKNEKQKLKNAIQTQQVAGSENMRFIIHYSYY